MFSILISLAVFAVVCWAVYALLNALFTAVPAIPAVVRTIVFIALGLVAFFWILSICGLYSGTGIPFPAIKR